MESKEVDQILRVVPDHPQRLCLASGQHGQCEYDSRQCLRDPQFQTVFNKVSGCLNGLCWKPTVFLSYPEQS